MEIPSWLNRHVTESNLVKISDAVAAAEVRTTAEIVPMVVRSSIVVGHVPWLLFFITLPIAWVLLPYVVHGVWGEIFTVVVAAIAAVGLKDLPFIQRWLTPDNDECLSVMRRAQLEFHRAGLRATTGHTGVLIFVSMLERKAIVLADTSVSQKFTDDAWKDVLSKLLSRVKHGDFSGGMIEAVGHLGGLLESQFPAVAGDANPNELPNTLIIKD